MCIFIEMSINSNRCKCIKIPEYGKYIVGKEYKRKHVISGSEQIFDEDGKGWIFKQYEFQEFFEHIGIGLCCEDCIVYQVKHHIDEPEECPGCRRKTLRWIQSKYGTMNEYCDKCGWFGVVDMNTICEVYRSCDNTAYTIHILPKKVSREKLYLIADFIEKTSLETLKGMKTDGFSFEDDLLEAIYDMYFLEQNDISYSIEPYDPRKIYAEKFYYSKECGYPHRVGRYYEEIEDHLEGLYFWKCQRASKKC